MASWAGPLRRWPALRRSLRRRLRRRNPEKRPDAGMAGRLRGLRLLRGAAGSLSIHLAEVFRYRRVYRMKGDDAAALFLNAQGCRSKIGGAEAYGRL